MAHVAFVCPPLRGHWEPTLALARAMAQRGHRASLITDAVEIPRTGPVSIVDPGLPASGGLLEAVSRRLGIIGTVRAMARRCDALSERLPPLFDDLDVDLVVADQTEPGGALAAMGCGLPYASLACALPLDREPGLPPPFVDWDHRPDGSRDWLYRGGHRVTDWLMLPLSRAIRRRAAAWDIPKVSSLDDTFSRRLQIYQLPRTLDWPRAHPPPHAHHVGPLRDGTAEAFAMPDNNALDDGRPLAFCSLGTLQGFRADLLRTIAASVAAAGLRPVIAHGGLLSDKEAALLQGDPVVAAWLPQRALLGRAALAVVHGGLNTVLDALASGVPLVVLPLAYEQGAIAARVAANGAGLVVKARKAARDLTAACRRVRDEPGFGRRAALLAEDIRAAGGTARAADLLEGLLPAGTVGSAPA
jgi:zeaxanthin glucosyltransferase